MRPHWPWEPIAAEMTRRDWTTKDLAAVSHYPSRSVCRWAAAGVLTDSTADRLAISLGRHPSYYWPAWFEAAPAQPVKAR